MSVNLTILLIILGCTLVTCIPRILPFVFVRSVTLPAPVIKWLSFIPICILTALVVNSLMTDGTALISIDWEMIIVMIPTLVVAVWTKSLSVTVIVGVVFMAVIRFVL